jgi:NAD-reducing hydrogenase small subunit
VDFKEFPEGVDVTLVEGAVSSEEDLHKILRIRQRTRLLLALGDCAVTANVPAMRNPFAVDALTDRAYRENATVQAQVPADRLPALRAHARPVHELVKVDAFIQGCPPSAGLIHFLLNEILEGRTPGHGVRTRFG